MAIGLFSGTAHAEQVEYQEATYEESTGKVTYTTKNVDATPVTSSTTTLNGGWYVVNSNVEISSRITVNSMMANLILADEATLSADKGINVANGNRLYIYAQSGGTGKLIATGSDNAAGIGGGEDIGTGGTVNIHGGTVIATGGSQAAGIGGGSGKNCGMVSIYGGTITATGGSQAAGIGGGVQGYGGNVNIHGGTVTATGGENAAGIGKGDGGSNGTLTLGSGLVVIGGNDANSATVIEKQENDYTRYQYMKVGSSAIQYVAYTVSTDITQVVSAERTAVGFTIVSTDTTAFEDGKFYVVSGDTTISNRITVNGTANLILADGATLNANAGIAVASGKTLNIYAQSGGTGKLLAKGGDNEAGIGGGTGGSGGNVNIYGGSITATGSEGGAGIGGGNGGNNGTVTIYGGTVNATGIGNGAGIGGGQQGDGGTVTIYGGSVTATGSSGAAGIGGGVQGNGGNVTINGGTVTATGGGQAAGIGGGFAGNGGNVTINGGTVIATGGNKAAGIGKGDGINSSNGTLTVGDDCVVLGGDSANPTTLLESPYSMRYRYMKVFQHKHNFTDYQLSGDMTITAVCSNADGDCPLTNLTATLIIVAPTTDGGAAVLSGDMSAFGVSSSDITYQQKTNGTWGTISSNVPSGSGFFKASITVGNETVNKTAFVTYGVSAITVSSGITHGTVTAPAVATVGVVVPLTISPETGYELDTLTPAKTSDGASISVTTDANGNKSFIMPDEEVTVNATFKLADYKISFDITNGSITVPDTAHYNNTVRFVITPDKGYGVYSFNIPGIGELNLVSRDTDTGVEIYEITMPNKDITVNLQLKETTIYTIFYKADDSVNSILYRFSTADAGFRMKQDAKVDDTACWGGQMRGVKDKESFTISFKVDSQNWTDLTCNVENDLSAFNSLSNGNAILIPGDESAFVASFMWGYYDTDENGNLQIRSDYGMRYYFVTPNTTSISVPNPTRRGYDFAGWTYPGNNNETKTISAGSGNTTVNIKNNITKTTLFGAIWNRSTSTVTYDLNGGSWSGANTATVLYGNKLTKPADPTRNAYAFNGWVVKSKTRAMKGSQGITLGEGSNFDFDATKITENMTLQAAWKHVHAYVRLPLSKINDVIPSALSQATIDEYAPYVHFSICSHVDDYKFEGHVYDKNGKCACGAVKPTPTVTLEETYGNRNSGLVVVSKPKQNSEVVLVAPQMGTDQFVKWEYRSLNGSTWRDLVSTPVVGFIIPGSLRVNAVYQSLNAPQLTLQAERYNNDGILFTMQYALPKGWKATNAYVIYGDNHMLRYMEVVRSHTPWATLELSDPFLGIPIPGTQIDIGTFDEATHYYDREDNILAVAENKGPLRYKMLNGEAVNIPGYNEAIGKKAQNLGQTSGYAYGGLTDVNKNGNNNRYFYVLGFVEYTDAAKAKHMAAVGPIAVTYNSLSSAVTETEIHTYNY